MKQGILLTAFNQFALLKKLVDFFDDDFSILIFLDKKSNFSEDEIEILRKSRNVVFLTRSFNVNWGGPNQLKSRLLLAEEALKFPDLEYFHFITGQDFPIKSCDNIKSYIQANAGKEFIGNTELPKKEWIGNGGLDRVRYYYFHDYINYRTRVGKRILKGSLFLQKLFRINRKIPEGFPKLYGGSPFWTLSYPCLKYIVDYTKENPDFLKRFEFCFGATEIYFQTILMNSHFKENVINKNLRYIDYQTRNNYSPAFLDETDYEKLLASDALFARKLRFPISEKLILIIEENILHTSS